MVRIFTLLFVVLLLGACENKKTKKADDAPKTTQEKIIQLSKEIESKPTPTGYSKRADLYLNKGEYSLAFDDINAAIKLDTACGSCYFKAAYILRKSKQINASINYAIKATQYGYNEGDVYLLLGENYLIFRKYQAAIDNLNQAMRADRFNEKIYFYKGMVYKESGDLEEAQSSFQTAIELNPQYAEAYNQLVSLAISQENYELAQTYLESGLRFNSENAFLWYNQGVSLQEQELYDSCIVPYLKAYRYDSSMTLSAFNLAWVYNYKGMYDESIKKLNRVLKLEPNNVAALHLQALNYNGLGDREEALTNLKKALTINPEYKEGKELYEEWK